LIAWLASLLLARNAAMTLPYARRLAKIGLTAAAVVLAVVAFIAWDWWDDRRAVQAAEDRREAKAGKAREQSADERLSDALRNADSEKELHDAIDDAPKGGELSAAAHALACERLRRVGRVPPACRPAGGNGSEAAPD
jgi:hypothetical protein